jgi:hypothetical protein
VRALSLTAIASATRCPTITIKPLPRVTLARDGDASVQCSLPIRFGARLAPHPGAGQHHFMDLPFADSRQIPDMAPGLRDIVGRYGLCRVAGNSMNSGKQTACLRECFHGATGLLRQRKAVLLAKQTLDKPDYFLSADKGNPRKAFTGGWDADAHQPERAVPVLVPRQLVPQTHDKDPEQLVGGIEIIKRRQLAAP